MSSLRPSRRSWSGWIQVSSRLLSPRRTTGRFRNAGAGPAAGCGSPRSRGVAFCSTRRRSVCVTGVRASASRRFAARTSGSFGHCGFAAWRRLRIGGIAQLHLRRQHQRRALAIIDPGALLRDDADRAEEVLGEHAFLAPAPVAASSVASAKSAARAKSRMFMASHRFVSTFPRMDRVILQSGEGVATWPPSFRTFKVSACLLQRDSRGSDTRSGFTGRGRRRSRTRSHRGNRPPPQRWPRRPR